MVSEDKQRSITYLPEIHEYNYGVLEYITRISRILGASQEDIFVESSAYEGTEESIKKLSELIREVSRTRDAPGLIGPILSSHAESHLRSLEVGTMPAIVRETTEKVEAIQKKMQDLFDKGEGSKNPKFVEFGEDDPFRIDASDEAELKELYREFETQLEINKNARDQVHAETLENLAPIGHAWAIGGSDHAAGVKAYLEALGWTQL